MVKNLTKVGLGIVTSVGGFLEVGSIGTGLQAGATYRFSLLWPIVVGTIRVAFLTEMTGRLAAVAASRLAPLSRRRRA